MGTHLPKIWVYPSLDLSTCFSWFWLLTSLLICEVNHLQLVLVQNSSKRIVMMNMNIMAMVMSMIMI